MTGKHRDRDRDCCHDPRLFGFCAFVTSDFIEPHFGCPKSPHLKLGKINSANLTDAMPVAAAKKNHASDTPENLISPRGRRPEAGTGGENARTWKGGKSFPSPPGPGGKPLRGLPFPHHPEMKRNGRLSQNQKPPLGRPKGACKTS
jgi:hypothetical protein